MKKVSYILGFIYVAVILTACGRNEFEDDGSTGQATNSEVSEQVIIKDLEMVEYGYKRDLDGYLQVAAVIKNPNSKYTAKSVRIQWTFLDDKGVVISEPGRNVTIGAGETIVESFPAVRNEEFAEVSVELEVKDENWIIEEEPKVKSSDISLSELKVEREKTLGSYTIKGFIENTSEFDISSVVVGVVFKKDGKIVGGTSKETYIPMSAGQKYDFEIGTGMGFPEMDNYDVYIYSVEE